MADAELKPCPFCGSTDAPGIHGLRVGRGGARRRLYLVRCAPDHGGCGSTAASCPSRAEASDDWNRLVRRTDSAVADVYTVHPAWVWSGGFVLVCTEPEQTTRCASESEAVAVMRKSALTDNGQWFVVLRNGERIHAARVGGLSGQPEVVGG